MFFGFHDTKQMTKLFHSPSIDEWMDAVSDGARRKGRAHAGNDQRTSAAAKRASARSNSKPS